MEVCKEELRESFCVFYTEWNSSLKYPCLLHRIEEVRNEDNNRNYIKHK